MDAYRNARGQWNPKQIDVTAIRRAVFGAVGLILLLVLGFTSYFTVGPEESALVLRFGAFSHEAQPGLHFKVPFGVDSVVKVPVKKVNKLEFGFKTISAGVRTEYRTPTAEDEAVTLILTGDLNIIDVDWVVQYRIKDARHWAFNVRRPERTIRDLSESVMRTVIGDHTIDEVLKNRTQLAEASKLKLQERLDDYELGARIISVELQDVNPPGDVKDSFNDVNAAQQERSRLENEALQEYNSVIPRARGQALQRVQSAKGYSIERVNKARGEVARFNELLAVYKVSPEVTRRRMYLEALEATLPNVQRIVVANEDGVLKLLPLELQGGGR